MTENDEQTNDANVFVSYSRRDRDKAQRVSNVLRERHFGVFRDTDDILPTEEWKGRLEQLISEADTIVFLLSPASATSEVCAWEIEHAAGLGKRIAPMVIEDVDTALIPPLLARLNFIFATDRDPFENAVNSLVSALRVDIDWIREHTRLGSLALRWQGTDRPRHLLLRGQDISDAEVWRDIRPADAPAVTTLQAEFISASRKAATSRQRQVLVGSLVGLAAAVILSVFAWLQSAEADRQREVAEVNEQRANETRDGAWRTQSRILTDWAGESAEAGDRMTASLLLLAALPDTSDPARVDAARPLLPEVADELITNYFYAQEVAEFAAPMDRGQPPLSVSGTAFSPDGSLVALHYIDDGGHSYLQLRRMADGSLLRWIEADSTGGFAVAFDPRDGTLLVAYPDHVTVRFDPATGAEVARFAGCSAGQKSHGLVHEIAFTRNARRFVTSGIVQCIWNNDTGQFLTSAGERADGVNQGDAVFFSDGELLIFKERRQILVHQIASGKNFLLYKGVGTLYLRVNAQGTRILISDTGSPTLPPGADVPEDHVWPSTTLWDLVTGKQIATISDREVHRNATFNDTGTRFVTYQGNRLRLWNAETGQPVVNRPDLSLDDQFLVVGEAPFLGAWFLPGSDYILSATFGSLYQLWDLKGKELNRVLKPQLQRGHFYYPSFGPVFGSFVSTSRGAPATLWRIGGATNLKPLSTHFEGRQAVPLSALETYFRQRSESKLQGGNWPNGQAEPPGAIFDPEGRLQAVWPTIESTVLRILDPDGAEQSVLAGHTSPILSAAFRPGSDQIATASRDGVRIWNARNGEQLDEIAVDQLTGLNYRHRSVLYSNDGKDLFVLGEDFLDALDAEELRHRRALMSEDVVFNASPPPDFLGMAENKFSDTLKKEFRPQAWAAAKDDYAPRFVGLFDDLQALIDHTKRQATRCLSKEQLERYHLGGTPPRWCITGPGLEDVDPEEWQPLHPYQDARWRDWLATDDPALPPPEK